MQSLCEESLQLTQSLEKYGAGSLADTRQAEELLHAAQANLPELRRQIAAQENTISILLGHNPEEIDRGLDVADQPHPEEVPTGVPSQLLGRRPFSRRRPTLIAANARIGVAKAQFFPQISLTSLGGSASNQLQSIFSGKNAYWYAAGSLSEPIFDGGRIRSNYHLSQAQQQEMLLEYRKTILNALKMFAIRWSPIRRLVNAERSRWRLLSRPRTQCGLRSFAIPEATQVTSRF